MTPATSRLILGIDTGGTYTDAAICRESSKQFTLLNSAKSRTTKENLTIGIRNAVSNLDPQLLKQISRVSLSTTLATNACVENIGCDVSVIIIDSNHSPEPQLYTQCGLPNPDNIVFLPGMIDIRGNIIKEPSHDEILSVLKPICFPGTCVAISGIFSTRNAALENKVAEVARELGASAVCGRDVAPGQLNYIKRAATAMLNGRLQPIIREFLEAVGHALNELEINVPIDIVRSDGSLMSREFALQYPVETLLCGPAASVSGVMNLVDQDSYLIADIGGTTTDLSLVQNGQAIRTADGVNIGTYRTCVQSVFVETLGLGGDTRLFISPEGILCLDNNRAIPLCVLAAEYPNIKHELRSLKENNLAIWTSIHTYEYRVLIRQPSTEELFTLSNEEKMICEYLSSRPHTVQDCAAKIQRDPYIFNTNHLEQMGIVQKSAFTMTDILHLQNEFTSFDVEASKLGAWFFCEFLGINETELCQRGKNLAVFRLYRAIIKMCIKMEHPDYNASDEAGIERMIKDAFEGKALLHTTFRLPYPLVGVGAAAQAFIPEIGKRLATTVLLPEGAAVANAIGAAACSIRAEVCREILYDTTSDLPYQVCGSDTPISFKTYEEALIEAERQTEIEVTKLARDRGILGNLKIHFENKRNILEMNSPSGDFTLDFGGFVYAIAETEVVEDVNRIGQ